MSSRYWLFTENNYDAIYSELPHSDVTFITFQEEVGENGTRHLQGYVELRRAQRLSWVRANISSDSHWEIRRGTQEEAVNYCNKEETRVGGPYTYGTMAINQSGKRSDLDEVRRLIDFTLYL